jgi:SNF2 family DNA or RNA helicase
VFGSSLGAFKQLYAIEGSHHEVVAWRNLESMQARFRMISHRVKVKEVLDLPEFRDQTIEVELGDEARSLYDEVEESFVAHVEAGTITVTNALTELLRLQQIASGAARFDGSDDVKVIDTAKEDALVELFDSLPPNEPVVVFCIFRFELDMVHRAAVAAERRSAELSGRRNDLDEWQRGEDGKTVIAVQIQAGGLGIDLTRACYSVYLSTGFSYGTVEQSRARTNRMGQTRPGLFIRIAARDTVDQMVERALAKKRRQASKVVDKRVEDNLVFDLMDMIKRGGDEDGERS